MSSLPTHAAPRGGRAGLACLLAAAVLTASAARAAPPDAAPPRPNIVFIVADDLGYGELGCYGGREIPTPHLDALAASGLRFTNGYVTAPFCAASRAALLTGRYQTRFGFEFNPIGAKNVEPGVGLPLAERTLADRLREVGYATGLVGKWHLGGTAPFHPLRRGFDSLFGFLHEGHTYVPPPWEGHVTWLRRKALPDGGQGRWTSPDGRVIWSTHLGQFEPAYDADNPLFRDGQPVDEPTNLTDAFTREAERFITRHKGQPFLLYLAYNAVHSPMQAADEYLERFSHLDDVHRRIFAAMLAQLDDGVGRVLARLRAEGLEQRTLVLFLSDNGGPTRELTSRNGPLRGEKGQLWEGGIRVPYLLAWPGRVAGNRAVDVPVSSLDATRTALELAGANGSATALDGVSLRPLFTPDGGPLPERDLYWRVGGKQALRRGDWKLVRDGGTWQLYHLADDVGETTDLAAREPQRVRELEARWQRWNAEQVPPLW